jgi:hypothetical protein
MTAHELARELLKCNDRPVFIPMCNKSENRCDYNSIEIKVVTDTDYATDNNLYAGFVTLSCY